MTRLFITPAIRITLLAQNISQRLPPFAITQSHPDHPPEYIPEVARIARELPESARAGFLGRNVLRAYGIES